MPRRQHASRITSRGVTMIEVLVTLVILLLALLGIAGLTARANLTELESYQRVQAVMLVQDMVDRINANHKVATCYSNGATGVQLGDASTGSGYTGVSTCASGTAQQNQQASADLTAWNSMLQGSAEVVGGSKVGAMIKAVGCVTLVDATNQIYRVSVAWQGLADTYAPTSATGFPAQCGNNLYKNTAGAVDEKLHRVVSNTVQIT